MSRKKGRYAYSLLTVLSILLFTITVSAHEGEYVETNAQSILLIILLAVLSVLPPLLVGYLTYYLFNRYEITKEDNFLFPQGLAFGAMIFLLFDYTSLSSIFGFNIATIVRQMIKIVVFMLVFFLLSSLFNRTKSQNRDLPNTEDEAVETSKQENNEITGDIANSAFQENNSSDTMALIFWVWFAVILVHTLAEGIIMGFNFTLGLIEAFIPLSILSFLLHKYAEGFIGAALYSQVPKPSNSLLWKVGTIAGLTVIPGVLLGYLAGVLHIESVVSGAIVFIYTISLACLVFLLPMAIPDKKYVKKETYSIGIFLGILFMYLGVILHELGG